MKRLRPPPNFPTPPSVGGFSLLEALVTVAILAIVAGIGAPSFVDAIERYRVNAVRDDLLSSIQLARTEAIRRGVPVLLSRTTACAGVSATPSDWRCGWEIFADTNRNGARDTTAPNIEAVIQGSRVPGQYLLTHSNGSGAFVQLNAWGQLQNGQQKFLLTPPSGLTGRKRTLCFDSGGRVRQFAGDVTC